MFYRIREKAAYSFIGKRIATVLRNHIFQNSRVHWVQQAMAELDFSSLKEVEQHAADVRSELNGRRY